jgi:hypothetical protein
MYFSACQRVRSSLHHRDPTTSQLDVVARGSDHHDFTRANCAFKATTGFERWHVFSPDFC